MKDQIDQNEAKTQKENKKMIEKALKLTQHESGQLTWKRERERERKKRKPRTRALVRDLQKL
jgi:hypothetical protein